MSTHKDSIAYGTALVYGVVSAVAIYYLEWILLIKEESGYTATAFMSYVGILFLFGFFSAILLKRIGPMSLAVVLIAVLHSSLAEFYSLDQFFLRPVIFIAFFTTYLWIIMGAATWHSARIIFSPKYYFSNPEESQSSDQQEVESQSSADDENIARK